MKDGGTTALGLRWARFVEAHRTVVALGALAVVVVVALPTLGLRLGSSDSGTDPSSWTSHQAYAALAEGFGPGFNGPLQLAGSVSSPGDTKAFDHLLTVVAHTSGVASVTQPVASPDPLPLSPPSTRSPARRPPRPSVWSTISEANSYPRAEVVPAS